MSANFQLLPKSMVDGRKIRRERTDLRCVAGNAIPFGSRGFRLAVIEEGDRVVALASEIDSLPPEYLNLSFKSSERNEMKEWKRRGDGKLSEERLKQKGGMRKPTIALRR